MTVEQIAIRQEIRQMLSEAGINRNTLKDMAKEVLKEELQKACKQALAESNVNGSIDDYFKKNIDITVKTALRQEMSDVIRDKLFGMCINIEMPNAK